MRTLIPLLGLLACAAPSDDLLNQTRGDRVDAYFNEPGTRQQNMWEPDAIDIMIHMLDDAQVTVDMAVMGFSYDPLVDAAIRAYDRGVQIRFVGDAGHLYNSGYEMFRERRIPMSVGNEPHIMHDKFMVVDDRFTMVSTANWTWTDLRHNSNNFLLIDSPEVAADFTQEFEQMFNGLYGYMKEPVSDVRFYEIGDTLLERWFTPNEDGLGRIGELLDEAQDSVRFTIFAFTKDQIGSDFIRLQDIFTERDEAEGVDRSGDFRDHRSVAGVIDKSQLHSNGQYHEAYRLLAAGVPMRMDGNDNSQQPGDYQAGGGRLHSKTMMIDVYGDSPKVISGSFNWSSSATVANDEYMLIAHGARVAEMYDDYFESLWDNGRNLGQDWIGVENEDGYTLREGDIIINEIMWHGVTQQDSDGFDHFIELRNMTDQFINLEMWQITKPGDFLLGIPPGSVIEPNGYFLILDHQSEPFVDGEPQDEVSAYKGGDLVLNAYNDNRQARMYLKDGTLEMTLQDPNGVMVDKVGDGSPPWAGGPVGNRVYSMERRFNPGNGENPGSWYSCTRNEGGVNVNDDFKSYIIATPGEPNSNP